MASEHGNLANVETLLEYGADVNKRGNCGATALSGACRKGHVDIVCKLITYGAHINHQQPSGKSPLHLACERGHLPVVGALLEARARLEQVQRKGATALSYACQNGHIGVVARLLSAGANVNNENRLGVTALSYACGRGHTEVVAMLCDADADVEHRQHSGCSALLLACIYSHIGCVQTLSAYGANRTFSEKLHLAIRTAEDASAANHGGIAITNWLAATRQWTPLHHLAGVSVTRIRRLLRGGGDINASVDGGPTPLSLAQALGTTAPCAALVLKAAGPWTAGTHSLFPDAARARARVLLVLGHQLSREVRFGLNSGALLDLWQDRVLPAAMARDVGHEA